MKKIIVFLAIWVSVSTQIHAQLRVGLKFGASSNNLLTTPLNIPGQSDFSDFKLSLKQANYGVHAGIFTQVKIAGIFIQPEVMFNSNSADYKISDVTADPLEIIKRESYQYVDVPILVGVKLGPLQLGLGPVGHFFLNSTSELFDIQGYTQKFKECTYGYQANAALVIGKLYIDIRHEGNFSKYGDHIEFFGHQYSFDKSPSRLIGSIGIAF